MASSAVKTAIDVDAKVIVVLSSSGRVASYVAKFRPCVSTLMVTPDLTAARQSSGLLLGVHTVQVDSLQETEHLIEEINYELVKSGSMSVGDNIVVVGGRMAEMKEQLRVVKLGEGKSHGRFVKGSVEGQGIFFNRQMLLSFGLSVRHI
jgi:pyruvate kinase